MTGTTAEAPRGEPGNWRKSRASFANGNCVECADGGLVRDTKLGAESPVLRFGPAAWRAFISGVKTG